MNDHYESAASSEPPPDQPVVGGRRIQYHGRRVQQHVTGPNACPECHGRGEVIGRCCCTADPTPDPRCPFCGGRQALYAPCQACAGTGGTGAVVQEEKRRQAENERLRQEALREEHQMYMNIYRNIRP